jgi:iron complex outermembrane recepter protein
VGGRLHHACTLSLVLAASLVSHAKAEDAKTSVALNAGRLTDSLRELSVSTHTGLLFSPDAVGDLRSSSVRGVMTMEDALGKLLEGSGLKFSRTTADTFVIFAAQTTAPAAQEFTAVPEIVVVTGYKTQNTDIRRTENDIQAYQVVTAARGR